MNDETRAALVDELAKWMRTAPLNRHLTYEDIAEEFIDRHIERLLAAADAPGLDELHPDVVVQRGCTKLMFFLSDYLETSTDLAGAAIEGIMDYCKVIGSDMLAIDFSSSAPEWREMSQEEQNQLWADVENLHADAGTAEQEGASDE